MSAAKGKVLRLAVPAVVVVFAAIQLVPVDTTNPAVETRMPASPETQAILKRACYDCHSNEVVWPWYSKVAPVSWWVARHVREGRRKLNYSTWNQYTADQRLKKLTKSNKELAKGKMPPRSYLVVHPGARLTPADVAVLTGLASSDAVKVAAAKP